MAKKPPSYAAVELAALDATPSVKEQQPVGAPEAPARRGRPLAGRTLKEAAAPVMLYLDPAALKALKRYALDQNTKVHTLLLEAVEAWFKSHGLREQVRVRTGEQAGS